jgi:hypothetical protein
VTAGSAPAPHGLFLRAGLVTSICGQFCHTHSTRTRQRPPTRLPPHQRHLGRFRQRADWHQIRDRRASRPTWGAVRRRSPSRPRSAPFEAGATNEIRLGRIPGNRPRRHGEALVKAGASFIFHFWIVARISAIKKKSLLYDLTSLLFYTGKENIDLTDFFV